MSRCITRLVAVAAGTVLGLGSLTAVSAATGPSFTEACADNKTGALRVLLNGGACNKKEQLVGLGGVASSGPLASSTLAQQVTVTPGRSERPLLAEVNITVPAGKQQLIDVLFHVTGQENKAAGEESCRVSAYGAIFVDGVQGVSTSGVLFGPGNHEIKVYGESYGYCRDGQAVADSTYTFTAGVLAVLDAGQSNVAVPAP